MSVNQVTLANAISEVVENLSMMVVEPPTEETVFDPELRGWIEFTGPVCGELSIRCREALARTLAANLLGTDQADVQTQANSWDALAELLNVVCGNLVTSLYDPDRPFKLSTPQIVMIPKTKSDDIEGKTYEQNGVVETWESQRTMLLLDGEPAEFILSVRG